MTAADRARYDDAALRASSTIIDAYSTSFGRAARMLAEPVRTQVRSIYGLVRLADEIVDGAFDGTTVEDRRALLEDLEAETARAVERGYSTNLTVHAFALTARAAGIDAELTGPFFESMRTDLARTEHDASSLDAYVHGSAEVVGLMCLRVFLLDTPGTATDRQRRYEHLAPGAVALGAAFQKVNFLRDLAADRDELGRNYLQVAPTRLTDTERDHILDDIDRDLATARATIGELPRSSRRGVHAAHALFAALSHQLRRTPAATIAARRVRVPTRTKIAVLARVALADARPGRTREVTS
ncbi:squalene/phytoene synthase family protein [Sanguibacter hominis ATCC BAA-789]|uniref:Squalene/phytoene synthase family protein n=1 Tax=Sanguibacter hominis ATCC BAA-789 TaxID=1312740 RepID=A0A9X5FAL6_9MICO|nr:squalene/phytoene synthase family protein [Sanguibacter hominis]NKX92620.1 squalene/phytoene synthase family protein [Sanguibacter hominis ATCC BAA-789]